MTPQENMAERHRILTEILKSEYICSSCKTYALMLREMGNTFKLNVQESNCATIIETADMTRCWCRIKWNSILSEASTKELFDTSETK
jgi:uncharacterized protein YfbU (UPF0304 family)